MRIPKKQQLRKNRKMKAMAITVGLCILVSTGFATVVADGVSMLMPSKAVGVGSASQEAQIENAGNTSGRLTAKQKAEAAKEKTEAQATGKSAETSGTNSGSQDNSGQSASQPKPTTEVVKTENEYEILVNKTNPLAEDYVPSDLTDVPLRGRRQTQMRKEASDALVRLFQAAEAEGVMLYCASGYRSVEEQAAVYQREVELGGETAANLVSAKPTQSEHQTGLAMDVTSDSVGGELTQAFAGTAEGKWIAENAYKYGFIIRYLKDKTDITGYSYEPWHIRYVGEGVAKQIHNNNLTLEEYLGKH